MTTIKKSTKLYLCESTASYAIDGEYFIFQSEMSSHGYVTVATTDADVSFEVPDDYDKTAEHIAILEEEKNRINAEAYVKTENIEHQIQSLLAIEDQSISNKD
jgi:hypothetical protein